MMPRGRGVYQGGSIMAEEHMMPRRQWAPSSGEMGNVGSWSDVLKVNERGSLAAEKPRAIGREEGVVDLA